MTDIIAHDLAYSGFDIAPFGTVAASGWIATDVFPTTGESDGEIRVNIADANAASGEDLRERLEVLVCEPTLYANDDLSLPRGGGPTASSLRIMPDGSFLVVVVERDWYERIIRTYECRDWTTFTLLDTLTHPDDDTFHVQSAGTPGWDGEYVEAGTWNGHPYYQLDAGHVMYWETYEGYSGWILQEGVGDPVEDLFYASIAGDEHFLPSTADWTYWNGAWPAPDVIGHELQTVHIVGDEVSLWLVAGTYGSPGTAYDVVPDSGALVFSRQPGGLWVPTDVEPFASDMPTMYDPCQWPSCALLPDGSLLVAGNRADGVHFARTRDMGETWALIITDGKIGEGFNYGTIAADEIGSVFAVGDGALEGADASTESGEELLARVLTGAATQLVVDSGVPGYVKVHPADGSLLVASAGASSTTWYRCRDAAEGFVLVS